MEAHISLPTTNLFLLNDLPNYLITCKMRIMCILHSVVRGFQWNLYNTSEKRI
jgi:hypothetical protein